VKRNLIGATISLIEHTYEGKPYLLNLVIGAMKEISIFIRAENLPKVTEILNSIMSVVLLFMR
jgi:hypothetical protein